MRTHKEESFSIKRQNLLIQMEAFKICCTEEKFQFEELKYASGIISSNSQEEKANQHRFKNPKYTGAIDREFEYRPDFDDVLMLKKFSLFSYFHWSVRTEWKPRMFR